MNWSVAAWCLSMPPPNILSSPITLLLLLLPLSLFFGVVMCKGFIPPLVNIGVVRRVIGPHLLAFPGVVDWRLIRSYYHGHNTAVGHSSQLQLCAYGYAFYCDAVGLSLLIQAPGKVVPFPAEKWEHNATGTASTALAAAGLITGEGREGTGGKSFWVLPLQCNLSSSTLVENHAKLGRRGGVGRERRGHIHGGVHWWGRWRGWVCCSEETTGGGATRLLWKREIT